MDEEIQHHLGGFKMKLTDRTTHQAKNYQCDKCKSIKCLEEMYDDYFCNDCWDEGGYCMNVMLER